MTARLGEDRFAATDPRADALAAIAAGIEAAQPARVVAETVSVVDGRLRVLDATYDLYPFTRIVVLGGGNAAAHVAAALEAELGDRLDGGVVVSDEPVDLARVEVLPGDHPVPSEVGVESTRTLLDRAATVDEDTLVLAVITGGGSALLVAPSEDVPLADLRATTEALLRSGASIHEINAVRKHCSAIKGGRLARALAPATTVALVLSDVVGDDLDVIASGPVVPDRSTYEEAMAVLDRYDLDVPASIRNRIEAGVAGRIEETPKPGDPVFDRVTAHVLANGLTALSAADEALTAAGYRSLVLSSRIEGEAADAGRFHAAVADEVGASGHPVDPPAAIVSGGETTVTVSGDGRGGPNQEFTLAAALASGAGTVVAAADTDGIDGNAEAAGAILDGGPLEDADAARAALDGHDVAPFLESQDALIVTGPTGTNVNDLRVLLVPAP